AALLFSGEGLRHGCRSGDDGVPATHGHPIHGPAEPASPRSDEADSGGAVNGLVPIYFASRMFDLRGCFLVMPVDTGNPLGDIDMANNQNNQNNQNQQNQNQQNQNQQNQNQQNQNQQ